MIVKYRLVFEPALDHPQLIKPWLSAKRARWNGSG